MEELRAEILQTVQPMPDHLTMIARYCPMAA
jgi:hypothetical protein